MDVALTASALPIEATVESASHGFTAVAPKPRSTAKWCTSRTSPDSTTMPTDGLTPASESALFTAATARSEGMRLLLSLLGVPEFWRLGVILSVSTSIFAPPFTASIASAASLSSAVFSEPSKKSGNVAAEKSGMLRRRLSSSSVRTGRVILTSLACSGVSARMFPWLPMYVIIDITSSSRIGSIGGFVTCAKSWWK